MCYFCRPQLMMFGKYSLTVTAFMLLLSNHYSYDGIDMVYMSLSQL